MHLFTYSATVVSITDGDTIKVTIDHGCSIFSKQILRLARIDAPERETEKGACAKTWLADMLPIGSTIFLRSTKLDKYGRIVAEVWMDDETKLLSDEIVAAGHAVLKQY